MNGALRTTEEGMEFTKLVMLRDATALAEWMDERELHPVFMLSLTSSMCAQLLPMVTGDTVESGDFWYLEALPGSIGRPPLVYQLVTTDANGDEDTNRALLRTASATPDLLMESLADAIGMYADMLDILVQRKQAES